MSVLRNVRRKWGGFVAVLLAPFQARTDNSQNGQQVEFLLQEVARINRERRLEAMATLAAPHYDAFQTKGSFDFQWAEFNTGTGLSDDTEFVKNVETQILSITDTAREWFQGKNVVDIGCGSGRFTYGLLKLGANVLACDQSSAGLERTEQLCHDFSDRLQTQRIDLLQWDESGEFDMAFSFGVVHHTGNTYRAIQNVCRKVKSGGKLFMMVYGFPLSLSDFGEVVAYEKIRNELAEQSFQQRKNTLIKLHGERLAHGWFDAVSPTINDLLTYAELVQLLSHLGFTNIRKTLDNRNHHLRADKSL